MPDKGVTRFVAGADLTMMVVGSGMEEGKAEGVDRAGAVTGGSADRVRQRRGEEDGAQVRVRVEVGAAENSGRGKAARRVMMLLLGSEFSRV